MNEASEFRMKTPDSVAADPEAVEIIRIWWSKGEPVMSIKPAFNDPRQFGQDRRRRLDPQEEVAQREILVRRVDSVLFESRPGQDQIGAPAADLGVCPGFRPAIPAGHARPAGQAPCWEARACGLLRIDTSCRHAARPGGARRRSPRASSDKRPRKIG